MNRLLIAIFLFFLTAGAALTPSLHAQNYQNIRVQLQKQQEDARSDIESLRKQIASFEQQVTQAADAYTHNYEQFQNLGKEIALRSAVLATLEEESASIQNELNITQNQIRALEEDLNTLISNYKAALKHLYKHGRMPDEVMLLTSTSINQMLVRSYYLQRFEEHRQQQVRQINAMQDELTERRMELDNARQRNRRNMEESLQERAFLNQRIQAQERQVAELRRDMDRLEQRLNATRREAVTLEETLTGLIEEEARIRAAEQERLTRLEQERLRRLAAAENIRSRREREAQIARFSRPVGDSELPSDELLQQLESSFEQMKGNLPWPVNSRVVSARFGNRVNPVYGTRIDNPGIEILAEPGSDVRSVHDGFVFAVQPIPGFGNCVFVKHGRYITVYGNMSEISVSGNSLVNKGDVIGRSGDENSLRGPLLFFMIRDQNINLDPEIWITSR